MGKPILGFIGFGEAAFCICKGLKETSEPIIYAYDVMANDSRLGINIHSKAEETGVILVDSLEELIDKAEYILNATSAKFAVSIANDASKYTRAGKNYADMNSASPMVKRQIAEIIEKTAADFTDAAVMEIVPPNKHLVPIAASGTGAMNFTESLNSIGMNITYINGKAGSSSSMKMFRSIFMKGFTSILLETLVASYEVGVNEQIMDSITNTLTKNTPEQLANFLINRTAVAASRRVNEMKDVAATLEEMNLPAFASKATIERLQWICDLELKEYFDGKVPADYNEVLAAISEKLRVNKCC